MMKEAGRYKITLFVSTIVMLNVLTSCSLLEKIEYRDRVVDHYITNVVHDTLIDKTTDSVYVNVYMKGDTVFKEKYKERTRWRDKIVERHDTCYKDSIVIEYKETTKEVVKIPKIYSLSLWFSIVCIIFAIVKLMRWLRMR